jgi:CheY-like chemotaxis protein
MQTALVLLVEDEKTISEVLTETLEEGGFKVVTALDGKAALRVIEESSDLKALVTDIKLGPGPDGWEVAHAARHRFQDIAVIYITGDSAHEWMEKGVPKSLCLQKPFAPAQIVTGVATLLNDPSQVKLG